MSALDLLGHALNFAAPALTVGLLLALGGRYVFSRQARRHGLWTQVVVNGVVGLTALLAGLVVFGNDGKMASYAVLVLCCATSQWWLSRR